MARTEVSLRIVKRWYFKPAVIAILILARLGALRDGDRAAKWLADHAIRVEVA